MHHDDWVVAELRTADDSAQTLVFDCSHESEMRIMDQRNLARQMAMAFAHNRTIRPFPFHFMFTSLMPGTNQYRFFEEAFGACRSVSFIEFCVGFTETFMCDSLLRIIEKSFRKYYF